MSPLWRSAAFAVVAVERDEVVVVEEEEEVEEGAHGVLAVMDVEMTVVEIGEEMIVVTVVEMEMGVTNMLQKDRVGEDG